MKLLRWTWKVVSSSFAGFMAQTDSPGTPVYCTDVADKLLAAAEALRQIDGEIRYLAKQRLTVIETEANRAEEN